MTNFRITKGEDSLALSSMGHITCIYGSPKAGKSTFALTATETKRCLFIDTENSGGKVWDRIPDKHKNVKNRDVIDIGNLDDLLLFMKDFNTKEHDMIIIDSLTHIVERQIMEEKEKRGKSLSIDYWGTLAENFKKFMARCQSRGISMIIVVHEEEIETDKHIFKRPKTMGNMISDILRRDCDNIVYITFTEGKRTMYTQEGDNFIAGCRDKVELIYVGENINYSAFSSQFASYAPRFASGEALNSLLLLIQKAGIEDIDKMLAYFGAESVNTIPLNVYSDIEKELSRRIVANEKLKEIGNKKTK